MVKNILQMKKKIGKILELPRITDPRGNLTWAEQFRHVPFEVKRVYWTYDVPAGESRGGHAHKHCRSLVIAVSGSFDVTLTDGHTTEVFHLNHPYQGLLIETGVWRTLDDFSSGSVCLVLASDEFSEDDYVRSYDEYIKLYGKQ